MVEHNAWLPTEALHATDYLPASRLQNVRDRLLYLFGGQATHARQSSPDVTLTPNTWSPVPFDSLMTDTVGAFEADNPDRFVCKEDGVYLLGADLDCDYREGDMSLHSQQFAGIKVNQFTVGSFGGVDMLASGGTARNNNLLTLWPLRIGDEVSLRGYPSPKPGVEPEIGGLTRLFVARVAAAQRINAPGWTSPITWGATAHGVATFQTHLSDNVDYLRDRTCARIGSTGRQTIPSGTFTSVQLPAKQFGAASMHTPNTSSLILPHTGIWVFGGGIMFFQTPNTGRWHCFIERNTSIVEATTGVLIGSHRQERPMTWGIDSCAAGDTLRLRVWHSGTGASQQLDFVYPYASHLWAVHLGMV